MPKTYTSHTIQLQRTRVLSGEQQLEEEPAMMPTEVCSFILSTLLRLALDPVTDVLCMHACMHAYVCVCVYACMRVYMYACIHAGLYACTYVCAYGCSYACV